MDQRERIINNLKIAEQQFRLACTVNLAVTNNVQTLDVPIEWTFGRHRVSYKEFGLRQDQADTISIHLEMTAMMVLAGTIKDSIANLFESPKSNLDKNVRDSYQISRMIRSAFAHGMIWPKWSIDADCLDRVFSIENIIELNTHGLHGTHVEWRHYGGPLAIFRFGRFVREVLLDDKVDPNRVLPSKPTVKCYQQGRLLMRQIEKLPADAVPIAIADGERVDLGGGHYIQLAKRQIN
ncbi:MAG: hypothetical protein K8F90_03180 [Hyphomicrobiales bacterium]|nr:hypothetical protein [Hyphomicrobiales bacterium]